MLFFSRCGMVALSMATSAMPPFVSADIIQNAAVERGFSRRGEMFSCDNLCELANDLLAGTAQAEVMGILDILLIRSMYQNYTGLFIRSDSWVGWTYTWDVAPACLGSR